MLSILRHAWAHSSVDQKHVSGDVGHSCPHQFQPMQINWIPSVVKRIIIVLLSFHMFIIKSFFHCRLKINHMPKYKYAFILDLEVITNSSVF
jgi:hypothetical protein